MASKKVHTQSHPDPELSIVIYNPENLLRRKALVAGSGGHTALHKSPSFSGELDTSQNLDLDTFPPRSLVRTRSETFVSRLVFDPTVLQPRTLEVLSPTTKLQITTSPIIQSIIPPPSHIMAT